MRKAIVLASVSPRRSQLLKKLQVDFEVISSGFNEPKGVSPQEFALTNAKCKAASCIKNANDRVILAADTVVFAKGEVLNKPQSRAQARQMLKMLSDSVHIVITAVCIYFKGSFIADYEQSSVEFYKFSGKEITEYINSGSPFDKAGGYGIQDDFIKTKIKRIEGSLDNIMGLPTELIKHLFDKHEIN